MRANAQTHRHTCRQSPDIITAHTLLLERARHSNISHILIYLLLTTTDEVGLVIIPVLLMGKARQRGVKSFVQGHTE